MCYLVSLSFFCLSTSQGDPNAFRAAIKSAREAWSTLVALEPLAAKRPMLLDLGGGFTGGFDEEGRAFVSVGSTARDAVAVAINQVTGPPCPCDSFSAT